MPRERDKLQPVSCAPRTAGRLTSCGSCTRRGWAPRNDTTAARPRASRRRHAPARSPRGPERVSRASRAAHTRIVRVDCGASFRQDGNRREGGEASNGCSAGRVVHGGFGDATTWPDRGEGMSERAPRRFASLCCEGDDDPGSCTATDGGAAEPHLDA